MCKIKNIIFILIFPINLSAQILFGACDYSHSSIFNSYNHFENGIYASTIASKGEQVNLFNDLTYIELDGIRYSLLNPEYFPMPSMASTEQILFDSKNAIVIGITLNGTMVTVTVLHEIDNGKLRQTSYTFANKYKPFSSIKNRINNKGYQNDNSSFNVVPSSTTNPTGDFLNGYTKTYLCDGLGKGLGLKISIRYPQSWKSEEGNRPHIVRKFSNDDFSVSAMIIVNDFGYIPSKNEIEEYLSEEFASQIIPKGGFYIRSSKTTIDGEKALVLDYSVQREKLGAIVKSRMRMYSIIYKNYLLQIQFSVGQNPYDKPIDLSSSFKENELLFNAMINSLVIVSKWEEY